MEEDVEGFMRLTREGARVSEADAHGWTPLHWACSRGSAVMTHVLLQELRTPEEAGEAIVTMQFMCLRGPLFRRFTPFLSRSLLNQLC